MNICDESLEDEQELNDYGEERISVEELLLDNLMINTPSDLFIDSQIFSQFFSLEMFQSLAGDIKERIMTMLPNFPENNDSQKMRTLEMLFGGQNFCFGNPLLDFRSQVLRGRYQPESILINKYVKSALKRDKGILQEEYEFKLMHDLLISRKDLLESTSGQTISLPLAVHKLEKQALTLGRTVKQRSKRRYLEDIQGMNTEIEDYDFSSDDEWILQDCQTDGTVLQLSDEYTPQALAQVTTIPGSGIMPTDHTGSGHSVLSSLPDHNTGSQQFRLSLKQETHASYFNLINDLFQSSSNNRATLSELESGVSSWQESPIAGLNSWYSLSFGHHAWVRLLDRALLFLAGQCPDQLPMNFTPFVSISGGEYKWEGSGRENELAVLFDWWWQRRDNFNSVSRGVSKVQPSSLQNRLEFQRQEVKRYTNPSKSFRWVMEEYSVCVGPIKSAGVKMKNHPLLKHSRPAYVTVLSLVRDAVSRLPNGEGTRLDILELLKDSQFIVSDPDLSSMSSTLSTALDRLQNESEPCVAFDSTKKMWVYKHRDKSMEELEILAQNNLNTKKRKFRLK